ncbi:hypothetical protein V490_06098 [Pseudogymnoascus sp. VKM F-3557]|nr:hypothetical protein V490_06098 [Pseudogymnoascus sp. VKM F-3557]
MARTKKPKSPGSVERRTTWTRFYLPRGQDWPTWSTAHSDPHRGPLTGVEGIKNVWLGRKVEDSEQAALIILWVTADALKRFRQSPNCEEFLQCLPDKDVHDSIESGAVLRDMSLGDVEDGSSLSPTPSRFLSFAWVSGYGFEENLEGRVTFSVFVIPYTDDSIPESSLRTLSPSMQMHFWKQWAMVDNEDAVADSDHWQLGKRMATTENEGGRMVICEFRQWNGYSGATLEREEATANSPLTRESWAQMLAKMMPPITAWEKERWDIQLVPKKEEEEEGEDKDPEFTRELEAFVAGANN